MKKQEVAKKMSRHDEKEIKDYVKFNPSSLSYKGKKGKGSLEIANPKIGKNMRGGKMVLEGNEHNRP